MLWIDGRVADERSVSISVRDRTFEHGLGLFETTRTWNRQAPLLDRHLARLRRSACELGLSLDGVRLPDPESVAELLDAEKPTDDVVLRLTLSGGIGGTGGASLWMRALPLPPPVRPGGAVVEVGSWSVLADDELARHKTLNYWSRRRAHEKARGLGFDEVLSVGQRDGSTVVWEGSRTNLFVVAGETLKTPSLEGPLVPGIMRALVLECAAETSLQIREVEGLPLADVRGADEVFLTNSARGVIPVARVHAMGRDDRFVGDVPDTWTQRLMRLVRDRLDGSAGGNRS
ncbi:MAG: aminotransferase class IV [Isosphaeraceae bacterium]